MQQNSRVIPAEESHNRRGTVAIFVVVMLPVIAGMAALAIDAGQIYTSRAATQDAADAGALAGASALREGEWEYALARALGLIVHNQEAQGFSSPGDQIVEVGQWNTVTTTFTPVDPVDGASANAVRVLAVRNELPLFFAGIFGRTSTDVAREAVALVTPSCTGIWGIDSIKIPGSVVIDSYNSTEGPYSEGFSYQNGDVCSNGTITVQGNATVEGDIRATDVVLNGGSMSISGVTEEVVELATPPPVDIGDALTNNDNATIGLTDAGTNPLDNSSVSTPGLYDLILNNSEILTLGPGTYIFDDILMHSSSSLTLTGPTTIYLYDDLKMNANTVINTTGTPADLTIICYGDSDDSEIELSGQAEFYGAILAPDSEIKLTGSADYYGAIIGSTVDFGGNFEFHFDESLPFANQMKDKVALVR